MYLYHFIFIDLESSRLCNFIYCKAYSYEPGLPYLLYQLLSNSHLRSHYFYRICSVSSFFKYQKPVYHRHSTETSLQPLHYRRFITNYSHYTIDNKHHQILVKCIIKPSIQPQQYTNPNNIQTPTNNQQPTNLNKSLEY